MAWEKTLLECSFDGVVFDVVSIRERVARAVAISETPYTEGGRTQDLGGRPVPFFLNAIWFGVDYEDRMREFLAVLNTPGTKELIHPVWGSIPRVQFLFADLEHAAHATNSCTVRLEFIESQPDAPFFEKKAAAQVQETVGAHGDKAVDESVDAVEETVDATRTANPLAAFDDLRKSMLGPVLALTAQVRGVLVSGLDVMNYPRAWARDIASLSNGLLSIASLPGRLMSEWKAITNVFKNIRLQWGYNKPTTGYAAWQSGVAPTEAQAQAVAQSYVAVSMATAQADAAAMVLASEATTPTLSPAEIETVVDSTRDEIDAAIIAVRSALPLEQARAIVEPLKDQALAIQEAAQAIIEARPPLVVRTLTAPGNLRLVAHRLYGDHTRADELLRLNNNLRNPNALQMGDALNAYAR